MATLAHRAFAAAVILTAGIARAARPTTVPSAVPDPPPVRSTFSEAAYAERSKAAVGDLGPPPRATAGVFSLRVTDFVDGDAPGLTAGLADGDVVTAVDGRPLVSLPDYYRDREAAGGRQTWTVRSRGRPPRPVPVPGGDLGVGVWPVWNLDAEYARLLPAGVAPSDAVRVACRAARTDPELAMAALAHAAAGPAVPAGFVDLVAANAAEADGHFDDALAYATAARREVGGNAGARLDAMAGDLAIATSRWPLAVRLGVTTRAVVALAAESRPDAPPGPAAADVAFVDRTRHLTNTAPHSNDEHEASGDLLKFARDGKPCPLGVEAGEYQPLQAGPAGVDVDLAFGCHVHPSRDPKREYDHEVDVSVLAAGDPVYTLTLFADGYVWVSLADKRVVGFDLRHLTGGRRAFAVRMTVVGDRCEYQIAGRRVYAGPVPATVAGGDRKLTFRVVGDGVKGELTDLHWRTAAARQP